MDIVMLNARAELLEIELKKVKAINELMSNYIGVLASDDTDAADAAVILAYSETLEDALKNAVAINDRIWTECYRTPAPVPAPVPAETEASVNEAF